MTPATVLPKMDPLLLQALIPFLERPLSPQRWRAHRRDILQALRERAETTGRTAEEELFIAAALAARIAQHEGRELAPRFYPEWVTFYRRRIQNLVSVDLLGLNWRRGERPAVELQTDAPAPDADAEAASAFEFAARSLSRSQREFAETWAALIVAGADPDDAKALAGERLGKSPAAVRQMHRRIRESHARGVLSGLQGEDETEPEPTPAA